MLKKIVIASFVFSMCSCSKVKNESVKVIQTDSFSNALVIKVNKIGKYCIYIPSDTIRSKFVKLAGIKTASEDSIWEIKSHFDLRFPIAHSVGNKCPNAWQYMPTVWALGKMA